MNWNFDMSAAPRDGSQILVATNADGQKLFITKWLPPNNYTPNGRFDGFSMDSESLLAWSLLPSHPHEGREA